MHKLTSLLLTAAFAVTACSGDTDPIAETEPVVTSADTAPPAPTTASSTSPGGEVDAEDVAATDGSVSGEIRIETTIDFDAEPVGGTFDVAVGAEFLGCRSGSVIEYEGPSGITDEFICEDGDRDGAFVVRWTIVDGFEGPGDVNGPWEVVDARGDFEGLTGEGLWSGTSDGVIGRGSFPGTVGFDQAAESAASATPGADPVEVFMAERLADSWIPENRGSIVAAIVDADGSTYHSVRTPADDPVAVAADDRFRVGSITKMFTAAAVLSLVDDGVVDLDAPAADYVARSGVPADVTVRRLLQHRSGIANYTNDRFFEQTRADDARVWTPEEVVGVVADEPAAFEAGSEFGYSNTNYVLLGLLIEEVTGDSYDEVLRARVIDPAGLTDTYLSDGDDDEPVAGAYSSFFTDALEPITADYTAIATGAWSAGALVSTAADLHGFFTTLFAGELISDELVSEMIAGRDRYGLGMETNLPFGEGLVGHSGGIMGFSTMALHSPETGRTGFWVATSDAASLDAAIDGLAPLLAAESLTDAVEHDAQADEDALAWEQGRDALVPAGTIRLPELGGIEFELDQERRIVQQRPAYTIILHDDASGANPSEVDLIAPTATHDGTPLTTVEELQAALGDVVGSELDPLGQVDTALGPALGFGYRIDVSDTDPDESRLQVAAGGWTPFPHGQFWLIDTERGLLLATAEAIEPGPLLDDAIDTLARLLETVQLVDPPPGS